ncbi:DUF6894 family protein [Sphingomonas crocodyli]
MMRNLPSGTIMCNGIVRANASKGFLVVIGAGAVERQRAARSAIQLGVRQCQNLPFTAAAPSGKKLNAPVLFRHRRWPNVGDLSGQELPDLEAARARALELANVALASPLGAWHDRRWTLHVYDMMGLPLFKIAIDVHTGLRIEIGA